MKVVLEGVIYGGETKMKNGRVQLTFLEGGKVRKVIADNVSNGLPYGSKVDVEVGEVSSIFNDFGDMKINAGSCIVLESQEA